MKDGGGSVFIGEGSLTKSFANFFQELAEGVCFFCAVFFVVGTSQINWETLRRCVYV